MSNDHLDSLKRTRDGIIGKISRKQQSGFDDCCKEFQFIRVFDTINFNNEMNRLGIVHLVLDEDYNFTEILESEIIEPIINHSNNTFGIIGKTGTGKSELAQIITLISKKANKDFLGRDVEFFLCYTGPEFHSTLKLLHKGDILWKDEMPKTLGKGSRIQEWEIENVLHSIRKMENTFIFVDPIDIKLDICDLYIKSAGMNFKTRTNRFMLLDENKRYFGHIYVKLHDNERLRYWYETQKDKFINKIKNSAGKVIVEEEKEDNNIINKEIEILFLKLENFLVENYNSKNKTRDIKIFIGYKKGETYEELAKTKKLSGKSHTKYFCDKFEDKFGNNQEFQDMCNKIDDLLEITI